MGRVAHLALMRVNPGPVGRSHWRDVAFKGGSETGVLNLTTQASDADGRRVCVSATWNAGRSLDESRLAALYASLFLAPRR